MCSPESGQLSFVCASQSLGQENSKITTQVPSQRWDFCAWVSHRLWAGGFALVTCSPPSIRWAARVPFAWRCVFIHSSARSAAVHFHSVYCSPGLVMPSHCAEFLRVQAALLMWLPGRYFPLGWDKIGCFILCGTQARAGEQARPGQWGQFSWGAAKLCRIHPALWWWMDTPAMSQPS